MSLYADYLKERTSDDIVETDEGFATYRYVDAQTVYIVDIFVRPEAREKGYATKMADMIAEVARKNGCKYMLGTVQVSAKGCTRSMKVLLAYGMGIHSVSGDAIIMRKEI